MSAFVPGRSGEHQFRMPLMGGLNAAPPGDMITTWDAAAIRVTARRNQCSGMTADSWPRAS
jgi:hypothetical protein